MTWYCTDTTMSTNTAGRPGRSRSAWQNWPRRARHPSPRPHAVGPSLPNSHHCLWTWSRSARPAAGCAGSACRPRSPRHNTKCSCSLRCECAGGMGWLILCAQDTGGCSAHRRPLKHTPWPYPAQLYTAASLCRLQGQTSPCKNQIVEPPNLPGVAIRLNLPNCRWEAGKGGPGVVGGAPGVAGMGFFPRDCRPRYQPRSESREVT